MIELNKIYNEDCIETMKKIQDCSIDCIITSPPYNKKGLSGNKKIGNQIWNKFNINYDEYMDCMPEEEYQKYMIEILNQMNRIIKKDGSIFFNHKPRRYNNKVYLPTEFIHKSQCKIYQLIIWNRKNSPNIRNDILIPNTEHIYWLTKNKPKVYRNNIEKHFNGEVWDIVAGKQNNHPAPFPEKLVDNLIKLTCNKESIVYDPFMGSGTVAKIALLNEIKYIGSEISKGYCEYAEEKLKKEIYGIDKITKI